MDTREWADLMGTDLQQADTQPLQVVRVTRNNTVELVSRSVRQLGYEGGERLRLGLEGALCVLAGDVQDGVTFRSGKPVRLPISPRVVQAFTRPDAAGALLVNREDRGVVLPVYVRAYSPDVLGPRFVDEMHEDHIVRHAVPGLSDEAWTPEALRELEHLLCSKPFHTDPISAIAQGDDWVAWMTRNRLVERPAQGDGDTRSRLIGAILDAQQADGSWSAISPTAYAILRLLALDVPARDESLRRAAEWLLGLPEPPPRPGMWMLTQDYLDEWMALRQPEERRAFGPTEIQWAGPGRDSFYGWEDDPSEQAQFGGQEMQQVIPVCARHHAPACEPRITHISSLVAEALLRCGYADHPRLRRYVNTVFHIGGMWGYWCGCGALGLSDADIPSDDSAPDLDVRRTAADGASDYSPWRWVSSAQQSALLSNHRAPLRNVAANLTSGRGTPLNPFAWYGTPGRENTYAVLGAAWQNGDCWMRMNRALSQHPACPGSVTERLAVFQASRYQTSVGTWSQAFTAGMLAFLALYNRGAAKALVLKTVPWLRRHQADDGLWHHTGPPDGDRKTLATPPAPRLATYHIVSALHTFGLLARLRP